MTGEAAFAAFSPAANVAAVSSWNSTLGASALLPYVQVMPYGFLASLGVLAFVPSAAPTTEAEGQDFGIAAASAVVAASTSTATPATPKTLRIALTIHLDLRGLPAPSATLSPTEPRTKGRRTTRLRVQETFPHAGAVDGMVGCWRCGRRLRCNAAWWSCRGCVARGIRAGLVDG